MYTCIPYNYLTMSDAFIPKRPVVAAYPKMPETFAEAEAMSNYLKEKGLKRHLAPSMMRLFASGSGAASLTC